MSFINRRSIYSGDARGSILDVTSAMLHNYTANDPRFPREVVLSARFVGYMRQDVANWLAAKAKRA